MPKSPSPSHSTPQPQIQQLSDGRTGLSGDGQIDVKQEGGGKGWMEGWRRGRGVTHIAEPRVFIEESVLIGKLLGARQRCTGTLLLVLHLHNPPSPCLSPSAISSVFCFSYALLHRPFLISNLILWRPPLALPPLPGLSALTLLSSPLTPPPQLCVTLHVWPSVSLSLLSCFLPLLSLFCLLISHVSPFCCPVSFLCHTQ